MRAWIGPAFACALLALAYAAWPNDVMLGPDEQRFIGQARIANAAGRLVDVGMLSTSGVRYPPLPHQVYQAMLLVAGDDVSTLISLHGALVTAATGAALLWLTRSLGWSPWLAPLPLLAPFFWHYARLPWGNPLAMPVGATLVAAWAAYLRSRGRGPFCLAAACAVALPLIHPMMLPLAATFGAHALVAHARAFRRNAWPLAAILVAAVALNVGYARSLRWDRLGARFTEPESTLSAARPGARASPARLLARRLAFHANGGELLSAYRFYDIYSAEGSNPTPTNSRAIAVARDASAAAYPLVWVGMILFVWRAATAWRARREPGAPPADVADSIGWLCLITVVLATALQVIARLDFYSHYHLATWPAAVVCLWAGLRALRGARLDVAAGVALAASLLTVTAWASIGAGVAAGERDGPGTYWTK